MKPHPKAQDLNLKRIKKTKPEQIPFKVEDLDEKIRRLQSGVEFVQVCNQKLSVVLANKKTVLEDLEEKNMNAKNFCIDSNKQIYSLNLIKNLEREYCLLLKNIRKMKDKIREIKSSKEYFEYKENFTLVTAYKAELRNIEETMRKMESEQSLNFKQQKKNLQKHIKKQEEKVKTLSKKMEDLENEIIALEIKEDKNSNPKQSLIDQLVYEIDLLDQQKKAQEKKLVDLEQHEKVILNQIEQAKEELKQTRLNFTAEEKRLFEYLAFFVTFYSLNNFVFSEVLEKIKGEEHQMRHFLLFFDISPELVNQDKLTHLKQWLQEGDLEQVLDCVQVIEQTMGKEQVGIAEVVELIDELGRENESERISLSSFVFKFNEKHSEKNMKLLAEIISETFVDRTQNVGPI